jgi:threonine synthase
MNTDIWRYVRHMPEVSASNRITLGEGGTPLLRSRSIGPSLGLTNLYFKLEQLNPTGSYKDRFAAAFVSMMKQQGGRLCIATSSGNTGAALSAYCAAAQIRCVLVIVDGAPHAKIRQMQLYGAETIMVKGFGKDTAVTDEVFGQLKSLSSELRVPLPVSAYAFCPEGMQGVQTMICEIMDVLPPRHVFSPAGGGGLTLAMARGGSIHSAETGMSEKISIHCVQPEGNDTIATAIRAGLPGGTAVPASTTGISGLQVPGVLDADEVVQACRASGGNGHVVSDEEVFHWHRTMAQREGIFCEPAGAVALAGLAGAVARGEVGRDDRIVCLVTGSGFKDMATVERRFGLPEIVTISPEQMVRHIESNEHS